MKENIVNCILAPKTPAQKIQYVTFAHISPAKANYKAIFNFKLVVLPEKDREGFVNSFNDYPKGYLPSTEIVSIYTPTSNVTRVLSAAQT